MVQGSRRARRGRDNVHLNELHDGTRKGYPCDTFATLADTLRIPVIASGGAGSADDIAHVLTVSKADAALAASIFHYGEISIAELKRQLRSRGLEMRM